MRSILEGGFFVLIVSAALWLSPGAHGAPLPVPLVPDAPLVQQEDVTLQEALERDGLWSNLEPALKVLGVSTADKVSTPHFTPARLHEPNERSYRTEGGIVLRVEKDGARIRSFRDEGRLVVQRPVRDGIDRSRALEIANAWLTGLGFGAPLNRSHLSGEADLQGQWRFYLPTGYEGVPCGGGFRIWVNGEGRIVLYSDGPPCVPPPSMEQSLSKRKASAVADAFLRERLGRRGVRTGRSEETLQVVHPNNAWRDNPPGGFQELPESRLAWVVQYPKLEIDSRPAAATVYVDARSGQVLGGVR